MSEYVLGVDFGTDSVRSILVDVADGRTLTSHVYPYPRWKAGEFCNPTQNQFRQHPSDHLEGLKTTIRKVVEASGVLPERIKGICIDTTGSSPLPVNQDGQALALLPEFGENPNAMVVLWKDHTAIKEADEINQLSRTWGGEDYTKYEGGIYSSEWFWAKILHVVREDPKIAEAAFSWMEHCDFLTYTLIGGKNLSDFKRSRCAAGHKALWHESWEGLPNAKFLEKLDPKLSTLRERLYTKTYTSDIPAGKLSPKWAEKLGLSTETVVAVGTFDAHAGAVGGEVADNTLVKVMGTSTCDIMVTDYQSLGAHTVKGICGQVDGSVIPGKIGLEAGQSGFGDVLAWFINLILQPTCNALRKSNNLNEVEKEKLIEELDLNLIGQLSQEAAQIKVDETDVLALDWINGRRTPDANQNLKGAILGLNMGTDAARVFKALVDAICFGSKRIVDRFKDEGILIESVIALGGVAKKSTLVMQTMADVLGMPIKVARSEQAPALGAAMYAAVASGIYTDLSSAIASMGNGFEKVYHPDPQNMAIYKKKYSKYLDFGNFIEEKT
ncbi:MAG: ribulokinase [Cyclobacteriaceae bacterium]